MDLDKLDTTEAAEAGVWMPVLHPGNNTPLMDGETPCQILVVGTDSSRFRKAQRAAADRRIRGGRFRFASAEEQEADTLELLSSCTLDWQAIDMDGAPFPYSKANAKTLYARFGWIRDQVDRYIGDRANFLPPSPTS